MGKFHAGKNLLCQQLKLKLRSQVPSKPHFHDASFSLSKVPVDILSLRCTLFTRDKNNTGFSKSLAATSDWMGAPLRVQLYHCSFKNTSSKFLASFFWVGGGGGVGSRMCKILAAMVLVDFA